MRNTPLLVICSVNCDLFSNLIYYWDIPFSIPICSIFCLLRHPSPRPSPAAAAAAPCNSPLLLKPFYNLIPPHLVQVPHTRYCFVIGPLRVLPQSFQGRLRLAPYTLLLIKLPGGDATAAMKLCSDCVVHCGQHLQKPSISLSIQFKAHS